MNECENLLMLMDDQLILSISGGDKWIDKWSDIWRCWRIKIQNYLTNESLIESSRNIYFGKEILLGGYCFGMSLWFIIQFLHIKIEPFDCKLKYITKQFVNGCNYISYQLQSKQCNLSELDKIMSYIKIDCKSILEDRQMLTIKDSILKNDHLYYYDMLDRLTDGIYLQTMEFDPSCHCFLIIVHGDNKYIFDSNIGTFKFKKESSYLNFILSGFTFDALCKQLFDKTIDQFGKSKGKYLQYCFDITKDVRKGKYNLLGPEFVAINKCLKEKFQNEYTEEDELILFTNTVINPFKYEYKYNDNMNMKLYKYDKIKD